jgi:hypothetical protein
MPDEIQHNPNTISVTDADTEICLNAWYFVGSAGMVLRIAAKAYALKGSDEEKLAILKMLAWTDYLTAAQGRIPERYVTTVEGQKMVGSIHVAAFHLQPLPVFDDLLAEIGKSLPKLYRSVDDQYLPFKLQLTEPFLWVVTSVVESDDGQLIARVS